MKNLLKTVLTIIASLASSYSLAAAKSYEVIDLGILVFEDSETSEDVEASSSRAYDINENNNVIGFSGSRAFSFLESNLTKLGAIDNTSIEDGVNLSQAFGINDNGQIVGYSTESLRENIGEDNEATINIEQAVYFNDFSEEEPSRVPNFTANETKRMRALSINNNGKVVGFGEYDPPNDNALISYNRGFIYTINNPTVRPEPIGTLDSDETLDSGLRDINNNTEGVTAVGWAEKRGDNSREIVRAIYIDDISQSNKPIEIPLPVSDRSSQAWAVNDEKQIVGQFINSNNVNEAFMYKAGDSSSTTLGFLNSDLRAPFSAAYDINKNAQIVGSSLSSVSPITYHAFLYEGDQIKNLNNLIDCKIDSSSQEGKPDLILYEAQGINDKGNIIANGILTESGKVHAFMLKPRTGNQDREPFSCISIEEEQDDDDSGSLPITTLVLLLFSFYIRKND